MELQSGNAPLQKKQKTITRTSTKPPHRYDPRPPLVEPKGACFSCAEVTDQNIQLEMPRTKEKFWICEKARCHTCENCEEKLVYLQSFLSFVPGALAMTCAKTQRVKSLFCSIRCSLDFAGVMEMIAKEKLKK